MNRSETIAKLAAALAKAQGEFTAAAKDHTAKVVSKKGEGSSYNYNYSDLASVLDAVRAPLAAHGLSVVQIPSVAAQSATVTTTLLHESGEFIEGDSLSLPLPPDLHGPQAIGSAITYARRYSLQAILAIASEDDDANAASGQHAETARREPLPVCPACKTNSHVIIGKPEYGGGFVCYPKKGGCGHKWHADPKPDAAARVDANRQSVSGEDRQHDAAPEPPPEFVELRDAIYALGVAKGNAQHAQAVVDYAYSGAKLKACSQDGALSRKVHDGLIDRAAGRPGFVVLQCALEAAGLAQPAAEPIPY
ncbi:MAG: ERF family protein [Acidiferrobacteraceae bacterium]